MRRSSWGGGLQPDIVLMDLTMPGLDGLGATRLISAKHLGVSENTVKLHVRNILGKLHLQPRASGRVRLSRRHRRPSRQN